MIIEISSIPVNISKFDMETNGVWFPPYKRCNSKDISDYEKTLPYISEFSLDESLCNFSMIKYGTMYSIMRCCISYPFKREHYFDVYTMRRNTDEESYRLDYIIHQICEKFRKIYTEDEEMIYSDDRKIEDFFLHNITLNTKTNTLNLKIEYGKPIWI